MRGQLVKDVGVEHDILSLTPQGRWLVWLEIRIFPFPWGFLTSFLAQVSLHGSWIPRTSLLSREDTAVALLWFSLGSDLLHSLHILWVKQESGLGEGPLQRSLWDGQYCCDCLQKHLFIIDSLPWRALSPPRAMSVRVGKNSEVRCSQGSPMCTLLSTVWLFLACATSHPGCKATPTLLSHTDKRN